MPRLSTRSQRRSIRLRGYDYSQPGAYFVTICTKDRLCLFGTVQESRAVPGPVGQVVESCLESIPQHFSQVSLDEYVIMPNHLHAIMHILRGDGPTGEGRGTPWRAPTPRRAPTSEAFGDPVPGSLATIIRAFKSSVVRILIRQGILLETCWQRGYYEHIIRNDEDLDRVRAYIQANPLRWADDHCHWDP